MFHLVYNSDDNYFLPTIVSAASALFHAEDSSKMCIDVLDCGIADDHWMKYANLLRKKFPTMGGLIRHRVDNERISKYRSWRGSVATYARILTPEILSDLDYCLFVDGDTLFVSDPLELERKYDPQFWIQGSVDYHDGDDRLEQYKSYGLTLHDDYVCCGFMLMNLQALRLNGFSQKCFDFLDKYNSILSVDQEAINSVTHGHIAKLDPDWGVFSESGYMLNRRPKCWHYVFGKPWLLNIEWTRCLYEFDRAWFSYARKTLGLGWQDFPQASRFDYFKRIVTTFCVATVRFALGNTKWFNSYFYQGKLTRLFSSLCPFYQVAVNN